MLAPFAPHFAEELRERMGHRESVFDARWPAWDEALVVEDQVEVVVQVNGKTRSKVTVPRDADEEPVVGAAVRDGAAQRFTEGKTVRKRIHIPNRLLNLVVARHALVSHIGKASPGLRRPLSLRSQSRLTGRRTRDSRAISRSPSSR